MIEKKFENFKNNSSKSLKLPSIDINDPKTEKLIPVVIDELIDTFRELSKINYIFNDQELYNAIEYAIKTYENIPKLYNILDENYDAFGNALVKLINLGYSVAIEDGDASKSKFDYESFFDIVFNAFKLSKTDNKSKLPKYTGPEIEHSSITASSFNIRQSIDNLNRDQRLNDIEILLGSAFRYGFASAKEEISSYRDKLEELQSEYERGDIEYLTLSIAYVNAYKDKD